MKVLVCGSRGWTDRDTIGHRIRELPEGSTVIVGGARGADAIAEEAARSWARSRGYHVRVFHADWVRDGKRAGILRNLTMLDQRPELVIAFHKHGSPGTAHTIREARKRGISVEVVS